MKNEKKLLQLHAWKGLVNTFPSRFLKACRKCFSCC